MLHLWHYPIWICISDLLSSMPAGHTESPRTQCPPLSNHCPQKPLTPRGQCPSGTSSLYFPPNPLLPLYTTLPGPALLGLLSHPEQWSPPGDRHHCCGPGGTHMWWPYVEGLTRELDISAHGGRVGTESSMAWVAHQLSWTLEKAQG